MSGIKKNTWQRVFQKNFMGKGPWATQNFLNKENTAQKMPKSGVGVG